MLQQLNEQQAYALSHADQAEDQAKEVVDPQLKSDYWRMAHSWRFLAQSYEFQHALERFISFQKTRKTTEARVGSTPPPLPSIQSGLGKKDADLLDRLARCTESIQPFSAAALGIAVSAIAAATLLRWLSGSTVVDLRFGIYVAAIMATGLLAGVPAAVGAATASIFIVLFAFLPPYFALKWPAGVDQPSLLMAAFSSLVTIYFAHCCRMVLRRLHQGEIANRILVNELEHAVEIFFPLAK
jgi:Domain of unknown function (DUF4118)